MSQSNSTVQDTEALILKAAEREFMAKGFSGARTTSIAAAAGVTHAMFHYYFRTKEKIFERIMTEKIALLKEAFFGSIEDLNQPLDDIVKCLIDRHLDFVAANPDMPRFLITEIYSNPERMASVLGEIQNNAPVFISILQNKIDTEAAQGKCRRLDAKLLMLDIASLNIFPYIASPVVNAALGNCMADASTFLARRKAENYQTIISKLKP